jgi:cyanuric acid amidohydrolase
MDETLAAMARAEVIRVPTAGPSDTSGLDRLRSSGVDLNRVRAVVGKTEGNGLVNDFSRELAARAWEQALSERVLTVMSGGTEGVLSPHVTLLAEVESAAGDEPGALALGLATSEVIAPTALGRRGQVDAVAKAVRSACAEAAVPPNRLALVLVKCPLLDRDEIAAAHVAGETLVTDDPYESMGHSRAASALGVALAVGELDDGAVERALAGETHLFSAVASTSAGREVKRCHVVVLGHSPVARGPLRATTTVMRDAIDAEPVARALADIRASGGRVVQVFAKAEADPSGALRGCRHTMLSDSDLHPTRHARAAVGGLLAGLTSDPMIYVSGGAEHQGPPGGGPVTLVWTRIGARSAPGDVNWPGASRPR